MKSILLLLLLLLMSNTFYASDFQDYLNKARSTQDESQKKSWYSQALSLWTEQDGIPGKKEALYHLSVMAFNAADYQTAIGNCSQLLKLDSEYKAGYLIRGKSLGYVGRWAEAEKDFEILLALDKTYAGQISQHYYYLSFKFTQDKEKYIQLLEASLKYDSSNSKSVAKLGPAYVETGRLDKASQLVEQLLARDKDNADAWYLSGVLAESAAEWSKAESAYKKAAAGSDNDAYYLAWIKVLDRLDRVGEAEQYLKNTVNSLQKQINEEKNLSSREKLEQSQATLLGLLSWVYLEQNKFEDAWKTAGLAWKYSPRKEDFWILSYYMDTGIWMVRYNLMKDDWKSALAVLRDLSQKQSLNQTVSKNTQYWEIPSLIRLLERRLTLGRIKPQVTHHLLDLCIRESSLTYTNASGTVEILKRSLKQRNIDRIPLLEAFSRAMIESMSQGQMTLDSQLLVVDSTLNRVFWKEGEYEVGGLDYDSITPPLFTKLAPRMNQFDTLVTYWAGFSGVAREAYGGLGQPVLLPWTVYGPWRGGIAIPLNWLDGAGAMATLVHELFHNIENTVGIWPMHGYFDYNKSKFPGYTGSNQWDYYDWQFQNTVKDYGWANFSWSKRSPFELSQEEADFLQKKYLSLDQAKLARSWQIYGDAKKSQGKLRQSQLEKVISLNPMHKKALEDLIWVYTEAGDYASVLEISRDLIQLYPREADYYRSAARAVLKLGRLSEAGTYLDQAVKLDPEHAQETVKNLEGYFWSMSTDSEKQTLAEMLHAAAPGYFRPCYYLAYLKYQDRKYQDSLSWCETSRSLYAWDPDTLFLMGKTLNYLGRYQEGESVLTQAVQLQPALKTRIAEHYYYLAGAASDKKLKIQQYSQSLAWDWTYSASYYKRGWVWYDLGEKDIAQQDLKMAADFGSEEAVGSLKKYFNTEYKSQKITPLIPLYKVAVYDNGNTWNITRILDGHTDTVHYDVLKGKDIRWSTIFDYDALIVGGGMAPDHKQELSEQGMADIRRFLQQGGLYLGICAGAFLSLDHKDYLSIINAKPKNVVNWYRGTGQVEVSITPSGRKIFDDSQVELRYANGPLFEPAGNSDLPPYEVLASFDSDMAENSAPRGMMPGTPAIITAPYGQGRVLIMSPHPEYTTGRNEMLFQALQWMLQQQSGKK